LWGGFTSFISNPVAASIDTVVNIANTINGWNDAPKMQQKLDDIRTTLENGFDGLEEAITDLSDSLGNRLQKLGEDR
jgi:cell division protein ZapA (FtsZ GTPase activity inhibitor)